MVEGETDSWQLENRYRHKLGHEVWGLSNTSIVRGEDGTPLYVISQVQDITERRHAEQKERRHERETTIINGILRAVNTHLDVKAAFPEVCAGLRELAGCAAVGLGLFDGYLNLLWREVDGCQSGEIEKLTQVANVVAIAVEKGRLFEQVSAGRERLAALSQRLLEVQEVERQHLARELHDEVGQVLTGLKLTLDAIDRLPPPAGDDRLRGARQHLDELLTRVRDLSLDLRPAMLDDLGLLAALVWLVDRYSHQTHIQMHIEHDGVSRRFAPQIETGAYRIVQEALTNVARHAGVTEATVRLWVEDRGSAPVKVKSALRTRR